ncbi:MAG: hypothetical protein AB7F76_00790 [Parvibaculaceae bacterium]
MNIKPNHNRIVLAVRNSDLPKSVAVDWSFPGCGELVGILRKEQPTRDSADIFAEVARRRGSIVSYEAMAPHLLRVRLKDSSPDDPEDWPALSESQGEDVFVLRPSDAEVLIQGP